MIFYEEKCPICKKSHILPVKLSNGFIKKCDECKTWFTKDKRCQKTREANSLELEKAWVKE